jgi:hypothetical protein
MSAHSRTLQKVPTHPERAVTRTREASWVGFVGTRSGSL